MNLLCKNLVCPTYGKPSKNFRIDEGRGDITCTQCGRVNQDKIFFIGEEKISCLEAGQSKARTAQVDSYASELASTWMESKKVVTKAGTSSSVMNPAKQKMPAKMKHLVEAKNRIIEFSTRLNLPLKTAEKAKEIFKLFVETSKTTPRGANSDQMILAVIYSALKSDGIAMEFAGLACHSTVSDSEIKKSYQRLTTALQKAAVTRPQPVVTTRGSRNPAPDLVVRYCVSLKLPEYFRSIAVDVARRAIFELEGKTPATVAAASIIFAASAAKLSISIKDVAIIASLTTSTINTAFSILARLDAQQLLPLDFNQLVSFGPSRMY